MATLLLVRHGQASFGAADYDQLSETGIQQSELLGRYWVRRGQRFDALFTGAQKRQRDTLECLRRIYRSEGVETPEPLVLEAFNEYNADGILKHLLPRLLEEMPELGERLRVAKDPESDRIERYRAFQEVLSAVMERWISGEGDPGAVETWADFSSRVIRGVEEIRARYGSGKTVAVFTSGGPIAAVLQYGLGTTDEMALRLSWVIKNASITEFKFKGDSFTLTGFNMVPHLDDDALVTYR